ncbi:hypothetical protein C0J52_04784, partial [Blattella germanica]
NSTDDCSRQGNSEKESIARGKFCLEECPLTVGAHCTWKGPLLHMKKHVMEAHGKYARVGSESTSVLNDVSNTSGYSLVIFAFEQVFLQRSRLQDCKFHTAVQYIGPKDNAPKYRYEFELSSSKGHHKIVIGNKTHSDADDLHSLNRAGKCVRLDHDVIKRFMYDDKLPYKLRLYKIEDEKF